MPPNAARTLKTTDLSVALDSTKTPQVQLRPLRSLKTMRLRSTSFYICAKACFNVTGFTNRGDAELPP